MLGNGTPNSLNWSEEAGLLGPAMNASFLQNRRAVK
jgi:hypothetical protein